MRFSPAAKDRGVPRAAEPERLENGPARRTGGRVKNRDHPFRHRMSVISIVRIPEATRTLSSTMLRHTLAHGFRLTLRWRKTDSNRRSPLRRGAFLNRLLPPLQPAKPVETEVFDPRGTGGSNPSSSSGES